MLNTNIISPAIIIISVVVIGKNYHAGKLYW